MLRKNRRAIAFKMSLFQDKLCPVYNIILYLQKSCIFFSACTSLGNMIDTTKKYYLYYNPREEKCEED